MSDTSLCLYLHSNYRHHYYRMFHLDNEGVFVRSSVVDPYVLSESLRFCNYKEDE